MEILKKEYDFGKSFYGDTISYKFFIKNLYDIPYKIDAVGESCGCTKSIYTKNQVSKGEFAEIEVEYIPLLEEVGTTVSKSIVVSDNSSKGFQVFYILGEIIQK
ncbi:DUF1573 domain-containing protein [Winogradskyella sp.]|nr:DUF1573 domain-containing protein [Winogradskyella sp.]